MRIFASFLFVLTMACTSLPRTEKLGEGFDERLSSYAYPFPVKEFSLKTQQQELLMSYMDLPAKIQEKGVIVLMHGKNFGGYSFAEFARDLSSRGYRVIMPDQIGFGKSSKPRGYQYSFAQLAANTKALLDSLRTGPFILLGHSMGGMLATRYALSFPTDVTKLVLVNPIGLEDYKVLTPYRTIDELWANELKADESTIRAYQREAYYAGEWKPAYDALIVPAVGWTRGPDKANLAYTAALTTDMIYQQPVVYEFSRLKVPTLLVIGQRDRTAVGKAWASPEMKSRMGLYPELGKETATRIPKGRLVVLDGMGHVPFIEDYPRFAKAFFEGLDLL